MRLLMKSLPAIRQMKILPPAPMPKSAIAGRDAGRESGRSLKACLMDHAMIGSNVFNGVSEWLYIRYAPQKRNFEKFSKRYRIFFRFCHGG